MIAPGQSGSDQPIENLREQLILQVEMPRFFLVSGATYLFEAALLGWTYSLLRGRRRTC